MTSPLIHDLIWLVVGPPLWKIWVRHLGWWKQPNWMGTSNWWQPNHQPEYNQIPVRCRKSQWLLVSVGNQSVMSSKYHLFFRAPTAESREREDRGDRHWDSSVCFFAKRKSLQMSCGSYVIYRGWKLMSRYGTHTENPTKKRNIYEYFISNRDI